MNKSIICGRCFGYLLEHLPNKKYRKCRTCGFCRKVYSMIDWTNPNDMVSKHFSVKEALWLPTWGRMANESDGLNDVVKANLVLLCEKMDVVRDFFNAPINVHVTFRPDAYNKLVGGAPQSAHKLGKAMDFDISGLDCDDARQKIMDGSKLDEWQMRMEKKPGSNWVHLDDAPVINSRYFIP